MAVRALIKGALSAPGKVWGPWWRPGRIPRLVSNKLLIARPMDPRGKPRAVTSCRDTVDAGVGETVLIVSGSSARMASGLATVPWMRPSSASSTPSNSAKRSDGNGKRTTSHGPEYADCKGRR